MRYRNAGPPLELGRYPVYSAIRGLVLAAALD